MSLANLGENMYKREDINNYVSTTTESLLFFILEELAEMNKLLRGEANIPEPDEGKELSAQKFHVCKTCGKAYLEWSDFIKCAMSHKQTKNQYTKKKKPVKRKPKNESKEGG